MRKSRWKKPIKQSKKCKKGLCKKQVKRQNLDRLNIINARAKNILAKDIPARKLSKQEYTCETSKWIIEKEKKEQLCPLC